MPNQDLRRRAFATVQESTLKQGKEEVIDAETAPLAHAFFTAVTRSYGHRDELLPPPKSWKEMLNHKYAPELKAAAKLEIRRLTSKYT